MIILSNAIIYINIFIIKFSFLGMEILKADVFFGTPDDENELSHDSAFQSNDP